MNKVSTTILVSGLSTLMFAPQILAQASNFIDTRGYWAEQYITALADRSIIGGFPDGSFKPSADITRAQFAAIAVKALNLPTGQKTSSFTDVPANYWAAPAISAVSNSGLVTGFPDGTFRPEDRITRAQALVVLSKALGNKATPNSTQLNRYSDSRAVPDWATESVSKAANANIIVNFPDSSRIDPNNLATRGEVAGLMYQTLYKLGDRNLTPINIGTFSGSTNPNPPASSRLLIDKIETNTTSRQTLTQGDELLVTAYGTPRAITNFSLEGINQNRSINMTEVDRGVYEGRYTIRRNDRQINSKLTVSLSRQGITPTVKEFSRLISINPNSNGNNNPPSTSDLVIDRIETNTTARQTLGRGDELLVTAYGTPRAIANFRAEALNENNPIVMTEVDRGVYEGRYTVRRTDRRMNSRVIVSFARRGISPVTREFDRLITINPNNNGNSNNQQNLKPEITNFINNNVVRLPIDLLGQTLPNASVRVTVDTQRTVLGIVDFSQSLLNTTVRANRQGQFTVNVPSRNLPAGTVYRVRLTATLNNQSQSNEIILRQN